MNNRSLQTLGRFSVGGQGMKNRPWRPLVAILRTSLVLQAHICSCHLERSLVITHRPRLCDDKAPDHAWLHVVCEAHTKNWPSDSARLVVHWYVRESGDLSAATETDSGQQRPNQAPPDLPGCVHEGRGNFPNSQQAFINFIVWALHFIDSSGKTDTCFLFFYIFVHFRTF